MPLDTNQIIGLQEKGSSAEVQRAKATRESLFGSVERELRQENNMEGEGCALRRIDCLSHFKYAGLRRKDIKWSDGRMYEGFELMTN
ncbi:hypothetical protein PQX77_001833 [Marasmius sp. AFHP31]|nr:hypothetical protein PQX77_001833 [Marasmius sp. AFHP31]